MLLSKKIFLFVILLFVLLNATACTSENGTVKNKDENIQSLNSTFTSLITTTNKYDETNYVSEINKDNINSENDSKFILNGVGEIKWENEESPSICIISNNKTFNVYCIDGFFPPADHYLEYKIINYEKNDYILLHCENQHKRWYYILDGIASLIAGYLFVFNNYLPMFICLGFIVISTILSFGFKNEL